MTLGGTIDIPKIGPVPKVAVVGIAAAGAGFVGWRWWQARNAPAAPATTDPGFEDPGTLPGVAGAVPGDGGFGGTTGGTGGDATGQILTNAQWSNDALAKLTATGGYDAAAVATALGNYLGGVPLTTEQQAIVRAAIAVSGNPPVGSFSVIPGGDTALGIAPGNVNVTAITTTTAQVSFSEVNGAASYRVFKNGTPGETGNHSPINIGNLTQNSQYTVHVVAYTASGKASPDSPSKAFRTAVAGVGAPTGLRVTSASSSAINLTWASVPNARGYQIFVNGKQNGNTVVYNAGTARYLARNTTYTIGVRAINASGTAGTMATIKAKTAK